MSFLRKRWKFVFGVAISAVFLWFSLRGLHLQAVWHYIQVANFWWILPAVAVYFAAVWARTWRWHYLLRPLKSIPLKRLFPIVCIGYFGNNVYPARAGEVIRAFVLRRNEGISVSASFATIIVERVFDGLVMLLFVFFALPFVGFEHIPAVYRVTIVVASGAFFVALVVFLWMALAPQRFNRIYHFFSDRLVPARFRGPLDGFVERFMSGLSFLRSGRDVLMVFVTSVVIWLLETVKYWLIMRGFMFVVSFVGLMLMNGVVNLTTTLPSAPGYIGTFEVGAKVLAALGVDAAMALGYTLVLHAALWLPITLLGGYYMWREGVHWQDFDAQNVKPTEDGVTG